MAYRVVRRVVPPGEGDGQIEFYRGMTGARTVFEVTVEKLCTGSRRSGVMPGAGRNCAQEWSEYRKGRLRCAYCSQFVEHDERGRIAEHAKGGA